MKPTRVLLPINAKGTTSACADVAFGLARRFEAELEVLHPCPPPSQRLPYATELSPIYFEAYLDVSRKQVAYEEKEAVAWFEKASADRGEVEAQLLTVEGLVGPAVAQRAKTADLSVLPTVSAAADEMFAEARDAALFSSGRPALFVPDEAGGHVGETVVIAWKDSVESARAVAAAAPFLEGARRVRLISLVAEGEPEDETAAAMANYLTGVPSGRVEGGSARRARRRRCDPRGSRCRRAARHGRLWPLALAGMDLWRRDGSRSSEHRCGRPDVPLGLVRPSTG